MGGGSDRPCNSLNVLKHWSYRHFNVSSNHLLFLRQASQEYFFFSYLYFFVQTQWNSNHSWQTDSGPLVGCTLGLIRSPSIIDNFSSLASLLSFCTYSLISRRLSYCEVLPYPSLLFRGACRSHSYRHVSRCSRAVRSNLFVLRWLQFLLPQNIRAANEYPWAQWLTGLFGGRRMAFRHNGNSVERIP